MAHIEQGTEGLLKSLTPLMHAASVRESARLAWILSQSTDGINDQDSDGLTALHYAAMSGLLDNVSLLLEAGADPLIKDKDNRTAQTFAIKNGHVDVVVVLEDAEKKAPLIKPEEMPARIVQLEKIVEELRQQMADMQLKLDAKKPDVSKLPSPGA